MMSRLLRDEILVVRLELVLDVAAVTREVHLTPHVDAPHDRTDELAPPLQLLVPNPPYGNLDDPLAGILWGRVGIRNQNLRSAQVGEGEPHLHAELGHAEVVRTLEPEAVRCGGGVESQSDLFPHLGQESTDGVPVDLLPVDIVHLLPLFRRSYVKLLTENTVGNILC